MGLLCLEKTHNLLYTESFRIASAKRQRPASTCFLPRASGRSLYYVAWGEETHKNPKLLKKVCFKDQKHLHIFFFFRTVLRTRKSILDLRGKATVLLQHYTFQHLPIWPRETETLSATSSNHKWTLTLLGCHCWQRFRLPFYFWMDKVISTFTAGQHHMTAGVAQIYVGLTGFPLTP